MKHLSKILLLFGMIFSGAVYGMSDIDKLKYLDWLKTISGSEGALAVAKDGCWNWGTGETLGDAKDDAHKRCIERCNQSCDTKDVNGTSNFIRQGVAWCATKHQVTKTNNIPNCLNIGGRIFSSKQKAYADQNRRKGASSSSYSTASSSTGSSKGWCARITGASYEEKDNCTRNGGEWFTNISSASSKVTELKANFITPKLNNVWCVEKWDYTYMPYGQCVVRGGKGFSSEDQAKAENERRKKAEYKRIAASSTGKYKSVWCATKWRVEKILIARCTGKAFSYKYQAEAEHKRLKDGITPQVKTASLTIRSNVNNNRVYIDGNFKGSTRLDLKLPKGRHTIRIEKDGYEPYGETINLTDNLIIRTFLAKVVEPRPTPPLPDPVAGNRYALVVGNAKYRSSPLKNPVNDAEDITTALKRVGFSVQYMANVERKEFRRAIRNFTRRLSKGDVGLFYYSGHAVQSKGENYLIPIAHDVEEEFELSDEAVRVGWILEGLEESKNSFNVVVLDACRNNPFRSLFRSPNRGLAFQTAPRGTLIAFSAASGQVASDGGADRNSPFTKHLVKVITIPGISITQVFMDVRNSVLKDTNGAQTPWEYSSLTSQFYFSPRQ